MNQSTSNSSMRTNRTSRICETKSNNDTFNQTAGSVKVDYSQTLE